MIRTRIPSRRSMRAVLLAARPFLAVLLFAAAPAWAQILGNSWDEEGPSPIHFGQTEGITNNPVAGAINSVAAHPTNADILYVGAVNGGIWRTLDATSANPTWTRLTHNEPSQSIGTIEFDPTDGSSQTLLAGIGRFSSYGGVGGSRSGLLRTTDGINFTAIDGGMSGRNIVAVAARGATLLAGVDTFATFDCTNLGIFRSTNTGASWTQLTLGVNGFPRGRVDAMASDPITFSTLYASVTSADVCDGVGTNGIYKSTNNGLNWTKVSTPAMETLFVNGASQNVDIAVGNSNNVFVALVPGTGAFNGIFRSGDGGATWVQMDNPAHAAGPLHPGTQGSIHSSIAADPNNSNIVYLGGDRQDCVMPGCFFPNAIGAVNFSGNLARGDASQPSGLQWTPITHIGTASNSSPHADSRDMIFDVDGNLIETDDGGIYRRTNPNSSSGDWFSMNSNLQVTEDHGVAYDSLNDRLLTGNQDTGSGEQTSASGPIWFQISQGDGGDVISGPGAAANTEVRYSSFQNLGSFRRRTFDSSDNLLSTVFPALSGPGISPQFSTPLAINELAPNRILIGGSNGVFESMNRGDTVATVPGGSIVANSFDGAGAIAAGATGNADILYVAGCIGSCFSGSNDGLFIRTTGGGSLLLARAPSAGQIMVGATIDPDLSTQGFGVDTSTVWRTTNNGASFTNITGNLLSLNPGVLRSIEYINSSSGDAVVVGADRGVYIALAPTGFLTWARYGGGLPNSPVFELYYDSTVDDLFAGLFGGGTYRLSSVSNVCAESLALVTGDWKQISMPCNPGGSNTVNDVFGDDLTGTYDVNWVVFERDETNDQYVKLATTSPLSISNGYWIRTNQASQTVDVSGLDNVQTDHSLTGVAAAPPLGCAMSAGRCNKAGSPHAYDVCWSDVLVVDGGTPLSLSAADPGGVCQTTGGATCIMSRIAHKWTGSSYAAFDGQTPGMEGTLVPWDGFWVSANKAGISLRIPEIPGGPPLPCGPPAGVPGVAGEEAGAGAFAPWYIRLTAESGSRVDRSNVFGQAIGSRNGYDSFDLAELDPLDGGYLTVVFPHPTWRRRSGNYNSDYHGFRRRPRNEAWNFQVRSSEPGAEVVLSWEGPVPQIEGSRLRDLTTGAWIEPEPNGSYTFTMTGTSHKFRWWVLAEALPTLDEDDDPRPGRRRR